MVVAEFHAVVLHKEEEEEEEVAVGCSDEGEAAARSSLAMR